MLPATRTHLFNNKAPDIEQMHEQKMGSMPKPCRQAQFQKNQLLARSVCWAITRAGKPRCCRPLLVASLGVQQPDSGNLLSLG